MAEMAAEEVCCPNWNWGSSWDRCTFICPNGTTIDSEKVLDYESGNGWGFTCSMLASTAEIYQANSSYCGFFLPKQEELCCLPTISGSIPFEGNNRKVLVMVISTVAVLISFVALLAVCSRRILAYT
jgi:hypothetical protein